MSIIDEVKRTLAGWQPFDSSPQLLEVTAGGQRLRCALVALDTLACSFTRLDLDCGSLAGATLAKVRDVAEKLSRRLTYLLEPISPVETDALGCLVQMRSNPPAKDEDGTSYYELLVSQRGNLSLCRYKRTAGSPRTTVPAHVTREVLLRLVGDFSAAAAV
jgi:hypothetical protein